MAQPLDPELLETITNPNITYPEYYQVRFHDAYAAVNLCWEGAFEAPSATQAMALRK